MTHLDDVVAALERAGVVLCDSSAAELAARRAVVAAANEPLIVKIPARLKERYGFLWCDVCGYSVQFCRCAERRPDAPSADATAEQSLDKRIAEAKAGTP